MTDRALSDVVALIEMKSPQETYELLEAAAVAISYFKRPAYEITMNEIKRHRHWIPLYLSSVHVALEDIPAIAKEVDLLLDYARMSRFGT